MNDIQDYEFTIQEGTLYMLQTRTRKRTTASEEFTEVVKKAILARIELLEEFNPMMGQQWLNNSHQDNKLQYITRKFFSYEIQF